MHVSFVCFPSHMSTYQSLFFSDHSPWFIISFGSVYRSVSHPYCSVFIIQFSVSLQTLDSSVAFRFFSYLILTPFRSLVFIFDSVLRFIILDQFVGAALAVLRGFLLTSPLASTSYVCRLRKHRAAGHGRGHGFCFLVAVAESCVVVAPPIL